MRPNEKGKCCVGLFPHPSEAVSVSRLWDGNTDCAMERRSRIPAFTTAFAQSQFTLIPTVVTASASTTWKICLPLLTTTKWRFTVSGPAWRTATPVQSGFTV